MVIALFYTLHLSIEALAAAAGFSLLLGLDREAR